MRKIDHSIFATGDTFHCYRKSLMSGIIRSVTGGEISHNGIFLRINGKPYVIEAQKEGVIIKPFDLWVIQYGYNFIATRDPKATISGTRYVDASLSYTGIKYGFFDLARHWIYKKTRIWLGIDKEHKRLVCSEYRMLVHAEFYNTYELQIERMNPQEVYEWELSIGFEQIFEI